MKPVHQTKYGNEEGNCFAACVASILELPMVQVPDFCANPADDWFTPFEEWLAGRGLFALTMAPPYTSEERDSMPPLPYIAGGGYEGPTGNGPHAVVHKRGRLLHNPNPTHEGRDLASVDLAIFLVRAP
jgi:hypothetical protein